ncbi:MAG: hypothetical protein JW932_13615 [Deltaproteobacteria bacterium]|nr:hypothetical protein [Deltaproteobacteria bacterium]
MENTASRMKLRFDDIVVGAEIPALVQEKITTQMLVEWAAAVRDFFPVHYDQNVAEKMGFPTVIVHGPLKCALLARLMVQWIGEEGTLLELTCEHRKSNLVEETLICKGKVSDKFEEKGCGYIRAEIWVENDKGSKSAIGSSLVSLPL